MRRLAWQAGTYSAAAGLQRLLGLGVFLWMAKALALPEYAKFGLLYALQTGVTTFALAGVVETVVARLREHPEAVTRRDLYARAGRMFAITGLASASVSVIAVPLVVKDVTIPISTAALAALSGIVLAYASLESQLVRLDELHRDSLLFSFVPGIAGLLGGFVTLNRWPTVDAFFLGSSIGAAAGLLVMAPWRVTLRASVSPSTSSDAFAAWPETLPFVVVALFGWLSGYGNNYVANLVFGAEEIAKFTFLVTAGSVLQLVASALNQVWSPRFFRIARSEPPALVRSKDRAFFSAQAVVLGLAAAAIVAVYPSAVGFVGDQLVEYRGYAAELTLVLIYYVIAVPVWQSNNYFLVYGRGRDLMAVNVVSGIAGLLATVVLMLTCGSVGMYLGVLSQILSRAIGYVIVARRSWDVPVPWGAVAAGLAIACAGYALTFL